ncbi:MAG: nuclear transport factor 2 family protein, partial [Acidimicrobiia bacterium]
MGQAEMKSVVERYVQLHTAKDLDGVMECFADDASVWDPADGEPFVGADAIRAFFGGTHAMAEVFDLALTGPIACCGPFAAFTMAAKVKIGEMRT